MTNYLSINGIDLSKYVKKTSVEPMSATHPLATYGGKGLIITVEGIYDSDETSVPSQVIQPLEKDTASVDIGDVGYPYQHQMNIHDYRAKPVAGVVRWVVTMYSNRES